MSRNLGGRKSITRSDAPAMTIAVTDTLSTTAEIDLRGVSAWSIRSPNSDVTSVTVYGSTASGGTYTVVQVDAADVTVALSAAKWNNPNGLVFAFSWVKLVGNADGNIELVAKG